MNKLSFHITSEVEVSKEFLADIACSAIESGFGWFGWPTNSSGRFIHDTFLEDDQLIIPCDDPDNDDGPRITKVIKFDDMLIGMKKYFELRNIAHPDQYENIQDGGTDDSILQMAYFGEIIYG